MVNELDYVLVDPAFVRGFDANRLVILKMILAGYNNNSIAKEMNFSLKNIENIASKFLRRAGIITKGGNAGLINPRVRLIINGFKNNWLQYKVNPETALPQKPLTRNQFNSIMLCAVGCSNKAMSEILCVSNKTIESRLNSLFNQFGIKVKRDSSLNPRIKLLVSAYEAGLINQAIAVEIANLVDFENWDETVSNRQKIIDILENQQANKTPYLAQDTDFKSLLGNVIGQTSTTQEANSEESSYYLYDEDPLNSGLFGGPNQLYK